MNKGKLGAVLAAVSMLCAVPAQADPMSGAEKLRRLDIMLMVTGLRCRTGADDFQADFQQFEGHHIAELNDAARQLKAGLVHQFGAAGAEREMDRISVTMANPLIPKRSTMPAIITTNAPVGPPIWVREPPNAEIRKPAATAV